MANSEALTSVKPIATPIGMKAAITIAGALVVAAAAQVAIPVWGSPVPFTLQPLAVLIVGGLLGPRYGALSLLTYLAMGAAGLPVFTPVGLPGVARLFGPTGGYLLAYPVAACLVGLAVGRKGGRAVNVDEAQSTALPPYHLTALACMAGMVIIHAGGMAQLIVLTGSARAAIANGLLPFLLNDIVKSLVAAIVIRRFFNLTRALV